MDALGAELSIDNSFKTADGLQSELGDRHEAGEPGGGGELTGHLIQAVGCYERGYCRRRRDSRSDRAAIPRAGESARPERKRLDMRRPTCTLGGKREAQPPYRTSRSLQHRIRSLRRSKGSRRSNRWPAQGRKRDGAAVTIACAQRESSRAVSRRSDRSSMSGQPKLRVPSQRVVRAEMSACLETSNRSR